MQTVLVTGGLGFLGAATVVQLLKSNYHVIILDNLSNSNFETLKHLETITQKKIPCKILDMCHKSLLDAFFYFNKIDIVIHFAAFKSVPESVNNPLKYFENNLISTMNLLSTMNKYNVSKLVFSSSCSVYGNTSGIVTEETPFGKAQSPYALTKQMCEQMINNTHHIDTIILRYFNPVGVHPSLLLGEDRLSPNLVPVIVRNKNVKVFGQDYDTKDGTPLRDYVHVMDIADAHVCALERLKPNCLEIYNLGSGTGSTVLEVIEAFERVSGQKSLYEIVGRRQGDADKIYADTTLAQTLLNWKPKYSLDEMVLSYWRYYQRHLLQIRSLSSDVPMKVSDTNITLLQEKQ